MCAMVASNSEYLAVSVDGGGGDSDGDGHGGEKLCVFGCCCILL